MLVGGGIPFFPQRERRVDLELVQTRTFSSRVVYLRYRVAPSPASVSEPGGRGTGQEIAAFTSSATLFSTMGLHFLSAYETGHTSPSSRFAASWKPRVE